MASETSSSRSAKRVSVHPLCIATICDHFTRVSVGGSRLPRDSPVVGLLFGVQTDLEISIHDASDANYTVEKGMIHVNKVDVERSRALLTAVYPNYELLGWYALGNEPTPIHMAVHSTMMPFNESPLFLLMNNTPQIANQLPLTIFESEVHLVGEVPTPCFVELQFKLATHQAERVAVDQVTKISSVDGASAVEVQNQSITVSLNTFKGKLDFLIFVLKCMKQERVPVDCDLLRKASKICQQLPVVGATDFQESFIHDLSESFLITYMSAVTKTTSSMSELTDKYHKLYGDRLAKTSGGRF